MVKWYLFRGALKRNRTDGALVGLASLVGLGQVLGDAENQLIEFAADVVPKLNQYVPD